jgi:mannosyltransferase
MFRDEGASLYSAHLKWSALWQQSLVVDRVVLPYYWFLHVWLSISHTIEWARLPSLIAFAITVFIVGCLGERLGGTWCGVLASVVCATNPLMVDAALDARPYALGTLAATLSVAALLRWRETGRARWFWMFCLGSMLVVALQIFLVLAPLAVFVVALLQRPDEFVPRWRVLAFPLTLLAFASVGFAASVVGQQGQVAWIGALSARNFVDDMLGLASGGPVALGEPVYAEVLFLFAVVVVVLLVREWRQGHLDIQRAGIDFFSLCAAWAIVPTVLLVGLSIEKAVYVDRYVTSSVPGMALAFALLARHAFRNRNEIKRGRLFRLALVAPLVLFCLAAIATSREYAENLKGAAQFLASRSGPGNEVALPDHSLTTAVDYYLTRDGSTERRWPESARQRYLEKLDLLDGTKVFADASANVWLVNDGSAHGTQGFITSLERSGFSLVGSRSFDEGALQVQHFLRTSS